MPGSSDSRPAYHSGQQSSGYSFRKKERLAGRKLISGLFRDGRSIQTSFFTIYFRPCEGQEPPARVAISVPRRLFRRAVDRNLLKRRIRESYRSYKPGFYQRLQAAGKQVCMVIIYRKGEVRDFHSIRPALVEALELLVREMDRAASYTKDP